MEPGDWEDPNSRALALLMCNTTERLYLVLNAHHEPVRFTLPDSANGGWGLLVDTADGTVVQHPRSIIETGAIDAPPRALLLLESRS